MCVGAGSDNRILLYAIIQNNNEIRKVIIIIVVTVNKESVQASGFESLSQPNVQTGRCLEKLCKFAK